jgi:hypothetical protein
VTLALVDVVREHWGWTGVAPAQVTATSPFGHLVVKDEDGAFWYLDPEIRELNRIADDDSGLARYFSDKVVRFTWDATVLVAAAHERLGPPGEGSCYSLKPHALLQGDYAPENLCILPIAEVVGWTGDVERQTRHLPQGASFALKVVD